MEPSEEDPLLPRDNSAINQSRDEGVVETLVVYKKRWYMLLVFGSLCCFQGALCVVWSVVAESCEAVFGWSDADISLFAMWIVLTYIVGIGPFSWLMQNKGIFFGVIDMSSKLTCTRMPIGLKTMNIVMSK